MPGPSRGSGAAATGPPQSVRHGLALRRAFSFSLSFRKAALVDAALPLQQVALLLLARPRLRRRPAHRLAGCAYSPFLRRNLLASAIGSARLGLGLERFPDDRRLGVLAGRKRAEGALAGDPVDAHPANAGRGDERHWRHALEGF